MLKAFQPEEQNLDGAFSIEASAGTGKTHSITILWLRLLLEKGLPIESILISTFTRAATAELQDRLLGVLRKAKSSCEKMMAGCQPENVIDEIVLSVLKDPGRNMPKELHRALSDFDLAPIYTIHGVCQTLLSRLTLEMGGDPELNLRENDDELREILVEDLLMGETEAYDLKRVASIAKTVAAERGVDEKRVGYPPNPKVTKAEYEASRLFFQNMDFEEIGSHIEARSIGKSQRVFSSFADGVVSESLSEGVNNMLLEKFPEVIPNIKNVMTYQREILPTFTRRLIRAVRHDLQDRKREIGVRCFDDILIELREAIRSEGSDGPIGREVRKRYRAVIIDECQDNDGVQIEVFAKLFLSDDQGKTREPTQSMLVIGDPKQSIYRFRGSDLSSYGVLTQMMEKAPEMKTNWRSDRKLVEAMNQLFEGQESFPCSEKGQEIRYIEVESQADSRIRDPKSEEAILTIWSDKNDRNQAVEELASSFALECERLLSGEVEIVDRHDEKERWRPVRASDIAILAADHAHLSTMRKAIQKRGIPCQQSGRGLGKVIDSEEAMDVLMWLEALDAVMKGSGRQMTRMISLAATPLCGLSSGQCLKLAESPELQADMMMKLKKEAEALQREGPLPVLVRKISSSEHLQWNLSLRDGERRFTNWRQLGVTLQDEWATGLISPGQLASRLARRMATGNDNEEMMRLETDLEAVQLVTIHSSKGLEYPIVFCPTPWHLRSQQSRKNKTQVAVVRHAEGSYLDAGSESFASMVETQLRQEDEELDRLLYVSLTRPRHRLYMGMAPVTCKIASHQNGAERSPIARLMKLGGDFSKWEKNLPWPIVDFPEEEAVYQPPSDEEEDVVFQGLPEVDPWRGPVFRTSSYSSLSGGMSTHRTTMKCCLNRLNRSVLTRDV